MVPSTNVLATAQSWRKRGSSYFNVTPIDPTQELANLHKVSQELAENMKQLKILWTREVILLLIEKKTVTWLPFYSLNSTP